jgi:Uma2 family endonuclease
MSIKLITQNLEEPLD